VSQPAALLRADELSPEGENKHQGSWWLIAVATTLVVVEGYDLTAYAVSIPKLLAQPGWHLNHGALGNIATYSYILMAIGAILSGALASRLGLRRLILASAGILTVGAGASALAGSADALEAARCVMGLGMGTMLACALSAAKAFAPSGRQNTAILTVGTGIAGGSSISALVALVVLAPHGWREMFWIGTVLSGALIPIALLLPARTPPALGSLGGPAIRAYRQLFERRLLLITLTFTLASFASLLTYYGITTWLTTLMVELHYPLNSALHFSLTLSGGAIVGAVPLMLAAERWGARVVVLACASCMVVLLLLLSAGPSHKFTVAAIIALAGAFSGGAIGLVNASVANTYEPGLRVPALGVVGGIGRLGGAFAPTLGGWILDANLGPKAVFITFACTAGIGVLAALGLVFLNRRVPELDTPRFDSGSLPAPA
jgi:MFS transporter, AAHS family, benzoate transport protein